MRLFYICGRDAEAVVRSLIITTTCCSCHWLSIVRCTSRLPELSRRKWYIPFRTAHFCIFTLPIPLSISTLLGRMMDEPKHRLIYDYSCIFIGGGKFPSLLRLSFGGPNNLSNDFLVFFGDTSSLAIFYLYDFRLFSAVCSVNININVKEVRSFDKM